VNVLTLLRDRFGDALAELVEESTDLSSLVEMVLPSQDTRFGDYQANCAMPLGKQLGKSPREVAALLVRRLDVEDICEPPEIAGPGFINLRLRESWLVEQLVAASADVTRLSIAKTDSPRTIILDYSSPNVAKPMHVGHIRSTVIGDALYRSLRFLGHCVISDNHIGDWGTQFGMIIYGYKNFLDVEALRESPVGELSRLYKLVNNLVEYQEAVGEKIPAARAEIATAEERQADLEAVEQPADKKAARQLNKQLKLATRALTQRKEMLAELSKKTVDFESDPTCVDFAKAHPEIGKAVLAETAQLHAGNPSSLSLWRDILPPCLEEIDATYQQLGVTFNHMLGESFYHDRLQGVVDDLRRAEICKESDGAQCVFLEGQSAPLIVQKKDGAFLYATTDLATLQYRVERWNPDTVLYVVDHRQSQHFEQLFATARQWGYDQIELKHVQFGTVLGEDGKPYKTRSGTAIGLTGLLEEAVERALQVVSQNDDQRPERLLEEKDRKEVAARIGIGAVKYADLSHNRTSDYVFSFDKMLAMNGNTAAYMQYSYARVRSIFEKGEVDISQLRKSGGTILLGTPSERALGMALLQFSEAVDRVVSDYRPNHLTTYLFELASRYSEFFENCPVLKAENDLLRVSRLLLCDLAARTIKMGLTLLGIDIVERM
jgi:arginyl-tRNA synthetase